MYRQGNATRAWRFILFPSAANRPKDSRTFLKPDGKSPRAFSVLRGHFDAHIENGGTSAAWSKNQVVHLAPARDRNRTIRFVFDMTRRALVTRFLPSQKISIGLFWTPGRLPPSPRPDSTAGVQPRSRRPSRSQPPKSHHDCPPNCHGSLSEGSMRRPQSPPKSVFLYTNKVISIFWVLLITSHIQSKRKGYHV